jgi:O-Antigen ligase
MVDTVDVAGSNRRWDLIPAGLLAGAVGQAVLDQGGFKPGSREVFGALAALSLAAAVVVDPGVALAAARRPVAVVLWLLAVLGALSSLWTEGLVGDSLRWALVAGGYGAVYVCASVLSARHRRAPVAAAIGIAALATISTVVGLVAVARFDPLFADYVRATWRPGGTLEYSAALSLLVVSALPVLITGMCRRSPLLVVPASVCAALCTAGLALDRSRAEIAFAILVAVVAVAIPGRTVRAARTRVAGAVATLLLIALAARLAVGAPVSAAAQPHPARTLAELAAVCLVPAALWSLAAARLAPLALGPRARQLSAAVAAGAFVALAVGGGLAVAGAGHRSRVVLHGGTGGFWHGRLSLWDTAIHTGEDRPLIGGGADGFLAASLVHQPSSPIRFAHDLPLEFAAELGIAGFALALALYAATVGELWRRRTAAGAWWLLPAAIAFPAANLIDWPWHLAGCGAIWAAALGALAACGPKTHRKSSL